MSDEAKTIAEIGARHAHDIDALNSEPDKRWRLGAYAEKLIDDRAALLAIVKRQQEREAELREALTHAMGWIESWSPSFTEDEAWQETLDMIRKALAETAPIINITWMGGNCPVQAEGTVDGRPFYFRARGDCWSFGVGAEPVGNPEWEITAPFGKTFEAGWMDVDQARLIVRAAAVLYSVSQMPPPPPPEETAP